MIVEGLVLGAIVVKALSLGSVAKVVAVNKVADLTPKSITVQDPETGEMFIYDYGEFVDDEGAIIIDHCTMVDEAGDVFVMTKAETNTLRSLACLEKLQAEGFNRKEDHEILEQDLSDLARAIRERTEEIKRSPTRRARAA